VIMIRSPLRISLGGGGTDLPSSYEEHSGFLFRFDFEGTKVIFQ
jgi:galactokinase/mevalonate kinase-like predicted kinase